MIDVTGVDLVKFAQKAYELSRPQGMGFLHFQGGPLSDADARDCLSPDGRCALSMDYVKGRSIKMNVTKEGDRLWVADTWYDHTDAQLDQLLSAFGIARAGKAQHGVACECADCKLGRGER